MKKIIALLLAVMMVVGLFAGCQQTKPNTTTKPAAPSTTKPAGNETTKAPETTAPKTEEITLKVWAPQEDQVDENSWLNVMLKKFEAAHPEYKITWELGVCSEGDAKALVGADPAAAADVYFYANDQVQELVKAGAIARLGGDVEAMVNESIAAAVVDTVKVNGALYGIPFTHNTEEFRLDTITYEVGSYRTHLIRCHAPYVKFIDTDTYNQWFWNELNDQFNYFINHQEANEDLKKMKAEGLKATVTRKEKYTIGEAHPIPMDLEFFGISFGSLEEPTNEAGNWGGSSK